MSLDYIARCHECKNIVFWASERISKDKHVAREIAGLIRDGLSVERMETEHVKADRFGHKTKCSVGIKARKTAVKDTK